MRNLVQVDSQRPTGIKSRPVAPACRRQPILVAATLVCAASMLILGVWAFSAPESFSRFIGWSPTKPPCTACSPRFSASICR